MDDFSKQQNIYWQTEAQSKSNELLNKTNEAHNATMAQIDAEKKAKQAQENAQHYESEVDYFVDLGEKILIKLNKTQAELAKTQADLAFYKNLLSKPLEEIAKYNSNFKLTYDTHNELLATWIINQRAVKELAMNLGEQLGINKLDIMILVHQEKLNVLEGKSKYGNNAQDIEFVLPYIESMKAKL